MIIAPGINIDAHLDTISISSDKIDGLILTKGLHTKAMPVFLRAAGIDEDGPIAADAVKAAATLGAATYFEPYLLKPGKGFLDILAPPTLSQASKDSLTGADKASLEAIEIGKIRDYLELVYHREIHVVKMIRRIARDAQIRVAPYTLRKVNITGKGLDTAVTDDQMTRVEAYRAIFQGLKEFPELPLSVIINLDEIDESIPDADNPTQIGSTDSYLAALPVLNALGWGFLAFVNAPIKQIKGDRLTNRQYYENTAWNTVDEAETAADRLSDFLSGQPEPMQGFAAMWFGAAYVPPDKKLVEAQKLAYGETLEADDSLDAEERVDLLSKFDPINYGGNYVPLATFAGAHLLEANQARAGYIPPAANGILLGYEVPKHFRVTLERGNDILRRGIINYAYKVPQGWTLWGNHTLDTQDGWKMINSRLVISVLRQRLTRELIDLMFLPSDPLVDSTSLQLIGISTQVCDRMVAEGGLIHGLDGSEPYRLVGPNVSETGDLTMQLRARPVGAVEFINVDIINTVKP